ncbi:MAG TPA: NHLP-related RiPP peptide [Rhodanobacteraceae bacterium]|jgi:putative modified peptide|nr:NHLP-related RiPP peptide [Rhodanobacteraceae bacterium]
MATDSTDSVLLKDYALVLLRKLADDDAYRAAFEADPAKALRAIGVPDGDIGNLPPDYKNIRLASKLIFQTALYQVIDNTAVVCLCHTPPTLKLAVGSSTTPPSGVKTPFQAS